MMVSYVVQTMKWHQGPHYETQGSAKSHKEAQDIQAYYLRQPDVYLHVRIMKVTTTFETVEEI